MLIQTCLMISSLICLNSYNHSFEPDFYNNMVNKSYVEFGNTFLLKEFYSELYKAYDCFQEIMISDNSLRIAYLKAEDEFFENATIRSRYSSAPGSYYSKLIYDDIIYFKFINIFYDFLKNKHSDIISNNNIKSFLEMISQADQISRFYFNQALDTLEQHHHGIKQKLLKNNNDLIVISKVIRYRANNEPYALQAHYDRSVLSLLLDSSEDNYSSLALCNDVSKPCINNLKIPQRKFTSSRKHTSALLIAGAALERLELPIKPLLHAVLPLNQQYRYAMTSFLALPDVDMSEISKKVFEQSC